MSSNSPEPRADNLLDRVSRITGHAISWMTLGMVCVTFVIVILRYVFDAGLIWLQESVIWMHGAVFMLGAAYTLLDERRATGVGRRARRPALPATALRVSCLGLVRLRGRVLVDP